MALPARLRSARLTNASQASSIDDEVGNLEKALADLLGLPIDNDIAAAIAEIAGPGLRAWFFQDSAASPTVAGEMRRNGSRLQYHTGAGVVELIGVPTGTRMMFDQDTAPPTWTRDVALDDRVPRIVGGARTHPGSWVVGGLLFAGTALGGHTHGLAGHTHPQQGTFASGVGDNTSSFQFTAGGTAINFHAHHHDVTLSGTTGAPSPASSDTASAGTPAGFITSDGSWRPASEDVIVCVKD